MDSSKNEKQANTDWIIGIKVKIKTTLGEEVEGEIFSYDATTNCVVLSTSNAHSTLKKSYRIFKTNYIKEIQYLGKEPPSLEELENLPSVNIARIRSKEAAVLRTLREEAARIGVGVTEEAQDIFNALSKTLPCRWKQDTIVVFDEIMIRYPYTLDSCNGGDPVMLERVKKVLEGERKRIITSSRTHN